MTSRYEVGLAKAGVNTANTVMWALRAVSRRTTLYELGLFVDTAPTTAPQFVLARNTAGTVTATTTNLGQATITETAGTSSMDSAWSAAPTFTTAGPFIRRMTLPVTAGAGIIWTWPEGLVISSATITTALVIANAAATGATLGQFSIYASWDE
jgi:hypothetical protein